MPYIRQDMAEINVSVMDAQGRWVPFFDGLWYSAEGADLVADASKVRAGGMGNEVSLGGPGSRNDCTVMIPLDDVVLAQHDTLEQRVTEDAPTKVSYQFLNRLRQPYGTTFSVLGTLGSAALPDMSTGNKDAAMYKVIVNCDERAA
jgi:hypothetical protein